MIIAGLVLAGIAALLHVYIFFMESVSWTSEGTRAVFGLSAQEAQATKGMAFNQGFYNLFLAIIVAAGITFVVTGSVAVGSALVFAGAGSMVAAALVLFLSDASRRGAALKQGLLPLLGVLALAIGLVG